MKVPLVLFCLLAAEKAKSYTYDTFSRLKSEINVAKIEIGSLVAKQEQLFEELNNFEDASQNSEDVRKKQEDTSGYEDELDEEIRAQSSHVQTANVHTDVVFVGFPSSAVDYIERHWMDSLTHESNSEGSYGGKLFEMPGDISVKHHYHLLHVSFHAADLIRDTMLNMMKSSVTGDMQAGFLINAWEIEHMLNGLTKALRADSNEYGATDHYRYVTSNTIYILNIDFEQSLQKLATEMGTRAEYSYHNGFTEPQLDRLAKDAKLVQASRGVLQGQSNSLREVIIEKDQYTPSLIDKDAIDSIQSILPSWYWYGYEDHYRFANEQIHSRQVIKETRDWAQSYGDPSSKTLEQRAAVLLEASANDRPGLTGGDYRYALARAILRHAEEKREGKSPREYRDPSCGARTWISGANFAWIDEGASSREPHAQYRYGPQWDAEVTQVRPQSLLTGDWVALGDAKGKAKGNVDEGLKRVGEQLLNHYTSVIALAKQTKDCPDIVLQDFPLRSDMVKVARSGEEYGYGWATEGPTYKALDQAFGSGVASLACVSLMRQAVLLRNAYYTFHKMKEDFQYFNESHTLTGYEGEDEALQKQEALLYLKRMKELHFDSLRDVIASIGVDIKEKKDDHGVAVLSDRAAAALGHLLANVLELSEQLTTPPLALHLNPHDPHLFLPGDTTLISGDSHAIGGSSSKNKGTHDKDSRMHVHSALERQRELSIHKVGLADFISNRVGQDQTPAEDTDVDDYSLITRMLPPLAFPRRIEVVVYIVRLQNSYEPVPVESVSTTDGFDFRQLVRSLSDLALQNQELSVSMHSLDVYSGVGSKAFSENGYEGLLLAMRSCRRLESQPLHTEQIPTGRVYLDQDCVWAHLKTYDIGGRRPESDRQGGFRTWESTNQHLPIFVLSVDEPQPLFANSALDSATVVADGVLAVQNAQEVISTGLACGKTEVRRHGRDPTGAVVRAAGSLIAGISSKHYSKHAQILPSPEDALLREHFDSSLGAGKAPWPKLADTLCMFGRSVSFQTSAEAELGPSSFSIVEISAAHRSRMLRLVGHCHVLLRESELAAPAGTGLRLQATAVRTFLVIMLGKLLHEIEIANEKDMQNAAAQANALYFIVEDWLHFKQLPEDIRMAIEREGVPLEDLSDGWEDHGHGSPDDEKEHNSHFSLWDLFRIWPTLLFLASFAASLYWPKSKKPNSYL